MLLSHLTRSTHVDEWSAGVIDQGRLPTLTQLVANYVPSRRVDAVLITHLLPSSVEYITQIHTAFPIESIVGVPYSSEASTIQHLRDLGFAVVVPGSIEEMFRVPRDLCLKALDGGRALLVQEVGGYLAQHTSALSQFTNFLGIVEDTNNGHWRYMRFGPHKCPVLSMAQSPLKDIEDTTIGDAVLYSVERILREEFAAITQGAQAGVIGFGKIGTSTAFSLKGREAVVSTYDINPAKDILAQVLGFFPRPLKALLEQSQIVVGCTGQTSVRLVDMPHIRDGALLVSASSKQVEFAVADFAEHCEVSKRSELVTKYVQKENGKTFYILNEGKPVNFRDHSIIGTILDLIYSELFLCMREIATGRVTPGLSHSPGAIHNEVSSVWLHNHSDEFSLDVDDKVWSFPDSLKLGLNGANSPNKSF